MNHPGKITTRLAAIAQILALTLLTSCTAVSATALGASTDTASALSNICHATGDPANPYEEMTLTNDIYPVPVNGCPTSAAVISDGKITICHATGNEANPYEEISVSANGLEGHGTHEGDIITSPETGCPAANPEASNNNDEIAICHATGDTANPYEEITVTGAELNKHLEHSNDFTAPINGCPASTTVVSNGKIAICHATSSETDPYEEINVSVNGLDDHGTHEGDIIPAPQDGCPATVITGNDKITICHATGSAKNPYNEITISVNGLSGHNKHKGDIIPAPADGCPGK
jgi:hypothetical protein